MLQFKAEIESPIDFSKTGIFAIGLGFTTNPRKEGNDAIALAKTYDYFNGKWIWRPMSVYTGKSIAYMLENPISGIADTTFDTEGFWTKITFKTRGEYKMEF